MTEKTVVLIVAAGKSERMGAELPKPYVHLGEEAMLRRVARTFLEHPKIDAVRVVIRREHHAYYKKAVEGLTMFPCVVGGSSRQESVRLGLESLAHRPPEIVLVHDAARPLVNPALIDRVLLALRKSPAVIPALPVTDTLKRVKGDTVVETVSRERMVAVQTPQGFHYAPLLAAHRKLQGANLTDDAAVVEKNGDAVVFVDGDPDNIKITTEKDIERMTSLLALDTETRAGIGYDVHALKAHERETPVSRQYIKLCGIKIPFSHYLEGHSDADVGLHVLTDAMLGAMGEGDIGLHFPPDDRKWQGAESERFLLHAYELLKQRHGEVVHLDVTLVCERPKIADHRQEMVKHIAQLLKIASNRVSVKATTSEKLGFIGRGEGIAAQAVVTIRLPRK